MKSNESPSFFWKNFEKLCNQKGVSTHMVAQATHIASSSFSRWKNGVKPNGKALSDIAEYFGVTVEYMMGEADISLKPDMKKEERYGDFQNLKGIPQRFLSLRHGEWFDNAILLRIMEFVYVSPLDLASRVPFDELKTLDTLEWYYDGDIYELILGIMDLVPDSERMKDLQELLSRVVLHRVDGRLEEKYSLLSDEYKTIKLMPDKLEYLYHGDMKGSLDWKYGLNFTELNTIRAEYGISFLYMFTGHEFSEITQI